MMSIKPGVRFVGVRPEVLVALMVAHDVYEELGAAAQFVVTSVVDGQHSKASLHYAGAACDLRLPAARASEVVQALQQRLGSDYDVELEADHVHIEWQPKVAYTV